MSFKARLLLAGAFTLAILMEPLAPAWISTFVGAGSEAYARVGHPLTPVSVAGVSRRTARRTTARIEYRQSIAGCSPYRAYYNCGGVYYAPQVQNGATVYVVVNP